MDKLGAVLILLRLMSTSLQLISIARQVLFGSLAVLLLLTRPLTIVVTLVRKCCKGFKAGLQTKRIPSQMQENS